MRIIKPEREYFRAFLPPAACSQEMYDEIAKLALENNVSKATIVRRAVTLFLRHVARKTGEAGAKNGQTGQ